MQYALYQATQIFQFSVYLPAFIIAFQYVYVDSQPAYVHATHAAHFEIIRIFRLAVQYDLCSRFRISGNFRGSGEIVSRSRGNQPDIHGIYVRQRIENGMHRAVAAHHYDIVPFSAALRKIVYRGAQYLFRRHFVNDVFFFSFVEIIGNRPRGAQRLVFPRVGVYYKMIQNDFSFYFRIDGAAVRTENARIFFFFAVRFFRFSPRKRMHFPIKQTYNAYQKTTKVISAE